MKISLRYLLILFALFFVLLTLWSLSSPIGSGVDTDYHLTSIWCANGTRDGICFFPVNDGRSVNSGKTGIVPFMFQMCDERNIYF